MSILYFILSLISILGSIYLDNTCRRIDGEDSPCVSSNKELLIIILMTIGVCLFFFGLFDSVIQINL